MTTQTINEWVTAFEGSKAGRQALESLEELYLPNEPEKNGELQCRALENCYHASLYSTEDIPALLKRKRAYPKAVSDALKAIGTLRRVAQDHPNEISVSVMKAVHKLKQDKSEVTIERGATTTWGQCFDQLLDKYAESLENSGAHYVNRIGPLVYSRSVIDKKKLPDVELIGLLFHLVLLFKDWTSLHDVRVLADGRKMPDQKHGDPCYKQAALFVNAALNKKLSTRKANDCLDDHLKNNPDLGIGLWPSQQ